MSLFAFAFFFFTSSSEGRDFFLAAVLMAESEAAGFAKVGWKNRLMSCVGDNYKRWTPGKFTEMLNDGLHEFRVMVKH